MKKIIFVFFITLSIAGIATCKNRKMRKGGSIMLSITSPAFTNEGFIPEKYSCKGEDINPELRIDGVPEEAKSLVLIMDDPDAPMGTWQHWLIWNIPVNTKVIKENSIPDNCVLGENDFRRLEYGGPCPPSGIHRYFFRLYALDTMLDLKEGAKRKELDEAIKDHIIAEAVLMGKFERK